MGIQQAFDDASNLDASIVIDAIYLAAVIDANIVSETAKKLDTKVPGTYTWYPKNGARTVFFFRSSRCRKPFYRPCIVFKNENRRAETRTNRT